MRAFVHTSHPSRVIFGAGSAAGVADEVRRLGGTRVLLLGGRLTVGPDGDRWLIRARLPYEETT